MFDCFYLEPENSLDVLIFGTSQTSSGVIPAVLYMEAGITSYNLSSNDSPVDAQYYWLRESLRYQTPEVVIINARYLLAHKHPSNNTEPRYRQALDPRRWSKDKAEDVYDVVSRFKDQTALSYILPILRFHEVEFPYLEHNYTALSKLTRDLNKGVREVSKATIMPQTRSSELDDPAHDPDYTLTPDYLRKMINLCKENHIEVILLVLPDSETHRTSTRIHNEMQSFADENGVALLDYFYGGNDLAVGIDYNIDFFNSNHLNINGSTKITRSIAEYLTANYSLMDHRLNQTDPNWEEVLASYYSIVQQYNENLRLLEDTDTGSRE